MGGSLFSFHTYGTRRYATTCSSSNGLSTDFTYTGQKVDGTGLMYYRSRYYDPVIGQFISPDTIVPDATSALDYNRYMMVRGNPLKYNDPSGHQAACTMDANGDIQCSDNAVTGGLTLQVDLADEPQSDNPDGTRQFLTTMGGLFIASMVAAFAPMLLPTAASQACADGDCTNEVGAVQQATTKGSLQILGDTAAYSASELNAAHHMANLGNQVILRQPTNIGRTSDLLVNEVPYDVYTPITTNANRIISAIASKGSQADGIVLDLSQTTVKLQDLGNILARVQGAGAKNITDIIVIGGQ